MATDPPKTPNNWWFIGFIGIIAIAATVWGCFLHSQAQGQVAEVILAPNFDLSALLAPFLLIATAIERIWEAFFALIEWFYIRTAQLFGITDPRVDALKNSLKAAEDELAKVVAGKSLPEPHDSDYQTKLDEYNTKHLAAEETVRDASLAILEVLATPEYISIKRTITTFGSLGTGILFCLWAKIGVFNAIGFSDVVDGNVDMIMSGLLVGAGSGPMHSFITILKEFRDSLAGLGNYAQAGAAKQFGERIRKRETTQEATKPGTKATDPTTITVTATDIEKIEFTEASLPDLATERRIRDFLRQK